MNKPFRGSVRIPGDKSISHRGIMLGALAHGRTKLSGFLDGADCRSSIACFRQMGIPIEQEGDQVSIEGKGLHGLSRPDRMLDVGNSGTTARLMAGILAGQAFSSSLSGDASIQKRPMGRIIHPLTQMGAQVHAQGERMLCPLLIEPSALHGIHYDSPIASAQVKSSILFAGLYAKGNTTVREIAKSRDHSERMLAAFGANLIVDGLCVTISPQPQLMGQEIRIPGDISSAAYWLVAATLVPGSEIIIENVNTNPTRDGILRVAKAMGASIEELNPRLISGEPVADLLVRYAPLHATEVKGDLIPTLIDELPLVALMAACAEGESIISDAAELRVKESDRIEALVKNLSAMGVDCQGKEDGLIIRGGRPLQGASIASYHDHRIAMTFTIASLISQSPVVIDDPECVNISYPNFYQTLKQLQS